MLVPVKIRDSTEKDERKRSKSNCDGFSLLSKRTSRILEETSVLENFLLFCSGAEFGGEESERKFSAGSEFPIRTNSIICIRI